MSSKTRKANVNRVQSENNERHSKKRSLSINSSAKKKSGSNSKHYKKLLTCTICDGDAHGYNFDAISCESCKAFFRRNAIRPSENFKCHGDGHCSVRYNVKKRCKKCRLEKCINSGMRKEWILSDKEKEEKRAKLENNRRLKQIHEESEPDVITDLNINDADLFLNWSPLLSLSHLTDCDWMNIQSIQDGFTEAVKLNQISGIVSYPSIQPIESTLELFRVPLYISSLRLISFIKQINAFQQLNQSEQIYLVKLNLLTVCFFHSIFMYDPRRDCYHEPDTKDPVFSDKDWVRTLNTQFHREMKQLRADFLNIFQMDNIVIKLFYLILLFSQPMFLTQTSSLEIDSVNIFKAQNVFTDLLYRYCVHQYGTIEAARLFSRYMLKIMKLQQLIDQIKYTIDQYVDRTQLSPLIQSLFE